jgi:hypothetical protein
MSASPCAIQETTPRRMDAPRQLTFHTTAEQHPLHLSLTATTKPQLATGPQKCVVLGPVGELMKACRRVAKDMLASTDT